MTSSMVCSVSVGLVVAAGGEGGAVGRAGKGGDPVDVALKNVGACVVGKAPETNGVVAAAGHDERLRVLNRFVIASVTVFAFRARRGHVSWDRTGVVAGGDQKRMEPFPPFEIRVVPLGCHARVLIHSLYPSKIAVHV